MTKPPMTIVRSPHFGPRNGYAPVALVEHVMAGSLAGTDAWFRNPTSKVSAHFGIGRSGIIHQYVEEAAAAWHAGVIRNPTAYLIREVYGQMNPNLWSIGVEHAGQSGDIFPEAQYRATFRLHIYLLQKYAITADRVHLIGHYEIDGVNRPHCPGPSFPWDRLIRDLATSTRKGGIR